MSSRTNYPHNEALDDLVVLVGKYVSDSAAKKELMDYLELCRSSKTVAFRYIHEQIMNYRKEFSDYRKFNESESEMISDLMHFWE